MTRRSFLAESIIGAVAPTSAPRYGRFLRAPGQKEVWAVDIANQTATSLATDVNWPLHGPEGSHVFDAVWHPALGPVFAFGPSRGRGSWAVLSVSSDGSSKPVGVPGNLPVISLCVVGDDQLLLGVASLEEGEGRQVGGGIASLTLSTGRLQWLYQPSPGEHFVPSGVCSDSGMTLFLQTSRHVLTRLTASGDTETLHGRFGRPAAERGSLNTPSSLSVCESGYLVADAGNRRVLLMDRSGEERCASTLRSGELVDPRDAIFVESGRILVADAGSRAVVELTADLQTVVRRWGPEPASGLMLSRPRSIDRAPRGELLIADTNNDRVVAVDDAGSVQWQIGSVVDRAGHRTSLRWPRSARVSRSGRIALSDSLNSRVIVIDLRGRIEHDIRRLSYLDRAVPLSDPHDARWIDEDDLLVADSAAGWVARVDCSGNARWVQSCFVDPHHAVAFQGGVLVADPGLGAVVLLDRDDGSEVWRRSSFSDPAGAPHTLSRPRAARATADVVLVADEDSCVLALDETWMVRWVWVAKQQVGSHCDKYEVPEAPRDLWWDGDGALLLSDNRRNCVVSMREA